ncbi:MAG: efflux RND transporter permease subunit, partial [Planctomycetes bacterium]|nr:efflux RND transporter permease subunit [Planctomycetota bacterium]
MRAKNDSSSSLNGDHPQDALSRLVKIFLDSNLSIILIVFSLLLGVAALLITPREEDPQIVVPMADLYVQFPGHSAQEVEQLVSSPLERMLYQIDGVEYVYSMSQANQAIITVRFYVGEDRERSLVKLFKKLNENLDQVAPGVTGWIMKPVEIDDVPIVTLTLTGSDYDSYGLRRIGEEVVERLAAVPQVSRAYVVGGEPRVARIEIAPERLRAYQLSLLEVTRAVRGANIQVFAGQFTREDAVFSVEVGNLLESAAQLQDVVVGVFQGTPVFLKDIATIRDSPDEIVSYVRHGWGPARGFAAHAESPGTLLGSVHPEPDSASTARPAKAGSSIPAVTIAVAKQKGSNAVAVAKKILDSAEALRRNVVPTNVDMVVTRNFGLTADEKVNELVEALGVAILIVILLLTLSMGWREALVVAVAVPVVFGLTLAVNLVAGYTINRVTLFALILSLGLLVDDPIVDVENISRHFEERGKASRNIVLQAVAEIRPPLISATLAVIVSFLPLFFITGMMGPYMSPMALNVPIAMLMSMVVAFTITPWMSYHVLGKRYTGGSEEVQPTTAVHGLYDPAVVQRSILYRFFRPLMAPLLATKLRAIGFLVVMAALTLGAVAMAALRWVPLKMLPFDNKNELLLVLNMDEGTSLERTSAVLSDFEQLIATVPEVTDYTSYAGLASPIDFNGLVRHYYLRQQPHLGELRMNFVSKKHRPQQSHAIALRLRPKLEAIARTHNAKLQIVELPPGPPVLASLVAEVYGQPE